MTTAHEKKRKAKIRALRRHVISAQIIAAEIGASDVIVRLSQVRDSVELTDRGILECSK